LIQVTIYENDNTTTNSFILIGLFYITMEAASPIADWRTLAASKRKALAEKIPSEWLLPESTTSPLSETSTHNVLSIPRDCGLLSERELDLTEKYDATALVEAMTSGKIKSVDVVGAFCKRAAIAQQCVNCLTEIMFEEAMARAKECDAFLEKEGRPMGALHGLPISLKVISNTPSHHPKSDQRTKSIRIRSM
jgi:amidase